MISELLVAWAGGSARALTLHERNVALFYSLTIVNKLSVLIFRIQKLLILFFLDFNAIRAHTKSLATLLMLFDIQRNEIESERLSE